MRSILCILTLFVCVVALECTAEHAEKSGTPTSVVVNATLGVSKEDKAGSEHAGLPSGAERMGDNGEANGSSGSGGVDPSKSAPTDPRAEPSASGSLDSGKDTHSSDGSQQAVVIPAPVSAPTSAPDTVGNGLINSNPAEISKGDISDPAKPGEDGDRHNPSGDGRQGAGSAGSIPVKVDRTDQNPSVVEDIAKRDGEDGINRSGSPPTDGSHKTSSAHSDGRPEVPPGPEPSLSLQSKHSSDGGAGNASRDSGSINGATGSGMGVSTGSDHVSAGPSKPDSSPTVDIGTNNNVNTGSSPSAATAAAPGGPSAGNGNGEPTLKTKVGQQNQTKILNSQNPGDKEGLQNSSKSTLPNPQMQKNKVPTPSTPHGKKEKDPGASEKIQQKGDNTIKTQVAYDQGNAGTLKDTKAGTSVSPNKSVKSAPKPEPVVTAGTKNLTDSTTITTQMADDVQSTTVVHNTSTAPTIPLNKLSKAAQQLQSLDNKDSSSSSSLLLAFATFFTIATMALAPAY